MASARARSSSASSALTDDVRRPWILRARAGEPLDLDALDDLQAALLESVAADDEVEVDDPRFDAVVDILGGLALADPGEPSIPWARGQLLADLARPGDAVADLLTVARRCLEQAATLTGDPAGDARLWADAAQARAALALARSAQPLAAAVALGPVADPERRDDVALLLERFTSEGDLRVPIVAALLDGAEPDLEALEHVQVWAARQALEGNHAASLAVLDVLAALALVLPDEPAHPWNRSALLFELERPLEAAADKLEAARRMQAAGDTGDLDRARFHACLGLLLASQPLSAAVVVPSIGDPGFRNEIQGLLDDWLDG